MTKITWPLMHNNITRSDLDQIINYLKMNDPKLTQGTQFRNFDIRSKIGASSVYIPN